MSDFLIQTVKEIMNTVNSDEINSPTVLATKWEVLLARMCLRLCEESGAKDADQEMLAMYNELKPLAEHVLRGGHRARDVMGGVARARP